MHMHMCILMCMACARHHVHRCRRPAGPPPSRSRLAAASLGAALAACGDDDDDDGVSLVHVCLDDGMSLAR